MKDAEEQAQQFSTAWHGLEQIYEDYSRSTEFSTMSLWVLTLIASMDECTQKKICDRTLYPKQTVNSIIASLEKKKLIKLAQSDTDNRVKIIHLTAKGTKEAGASIDHVKNAQLTAIQKLSKQEREALISGLQKYEQCLRKEMLGENE